MRSAPWAWAARPATGLHFKATRRSRAGWHNFTATIFASHILFELDFGADGIVNANRIVTTSTGGSAAYNVLRLGGPSDLTSTGGGAGFDNVSLALFQPTKGIFNTGIGDMGNALLGGAVDPHFTVHTVAAAGDPVNLGVGAPTFVVQEGFPIGPWMANTPDSKWISSTLSTNDNPGFYDYNLVFDLIGNAGLIEGRWSVDNAGVDIFLNGVSTGNVNTAGFASWTDFMIDDGFLTGENVLTFRVENFPPGLNPAGLRVEFLEFLDFTINVPEPSAMALWVLIGLALLGTAGARRRRKMS